VLYGLGVTIGAGIYVLIAPVAARAGAHTPLAFFLAALVSNDLSNRLTGIHKFSINILYGLIALHVAAVAYYTLVKKESLVKPMITGWKELSGQHEVTERAQEAGIAALVIALVIALAVVYAASGAWIARPM